MILNSPKRRSSSPFWFLAQIWFFLDFSFLFIWVLGQVISGRLTQSELGAAVAKLVQPFWLVFETTRGWLRQPFLAVPCSGERGVRARPPVPLVGMRKPNCCLVDPMWHKSSHKHPAVRMLPLCLGIPWETFDCSSSSHQERELQVHSPRAENQCLIYASRQKTLRTPYPDKQKISMDSEKV